MTGVAQDLTITLEEACLGPAMKKLTEKQRGFVMAMIEQGGVNYTRAAREAGYEGSESSNARIGFRLAHDPTIQEAIKEVGLKMLHAGAIVAVKTVVDIAGDVSAEKKDRLKAAELIMNRTGMHALTEHKVAVTHTADTDDEMLKRMEQLAKVLNLDPSKLIGNVMIDADYEEVVVDENSLDSLL